MESGIPLDCRFPIADCRLGIPDRPGSVPSAVADGSLANCSQEGDPVPALVIGNRQLAIGNMLSQEGPLAAASLIANGQSRRSCRGPGEVSTATR